MRLEDDVDALVSELIPDNAKEWCAKYQKDKIIHDSLWGTFRVRAHEMALIDTRLLQRLRFIRQTGAVYLTYPSALHTRFEHTLGVLSQAARLYTALRRDPSEHRLDSGFENNVRFAALLHDTGHGPFSHTSEQYFSAMPQIAEFRDRHEDTFKDSGAGEIISYLIVHSKALGQFISAINSQYKIDLDASQISKMIIGGFDDSSIYKGEIIHGPFDADKLDYMPRDGMFSGLKMHVDMDRHSIPLKLRRVAFVTRRGTCPIKRRSVSLAHSPAFLP